MPKRKEPKVGTGKKPKGSDRRLYTDENPKDTVSIKYASIQDARDTVAKVKKIRKPFARQIQILTVGEQRSKYGGKPKQAEIFRRGKDALRKKHGRIKLWQRKQKAAVRFVQKEKLGQNVLLTHILRLMQIWPHLNIAKIQTMQKALRKRKESKNQMVD